MFFSIDSRSNSFSGVFDEKPILDSFSQKLNIFIEEPGDAAKVLGIMKKILSESSIESMRPFGDSALEKRVIVLREMLAQFGSAEQINTVAIQALKGKMKGLVEKKIVELKSLVEKEKHKIFCQKILTEIPSCRMASFINTVEGFYCNALSEGISSKEALTFALAKGMVRSMVSLPNQAEIDANKELQEKIYTDPNLDLYRDSITWDLILSDPLYWRKEDGVPCERYSQESLDKLPNITEAGVLGKKDPLTRSPISPETIKVDHKGREFVENKLIDLVYPELSCVLDSELVSHVKVEALYSQRFLLALAAAYPLIKEVYKEVYSQPNDQRVLVSRVEASARKVVDQFRVLVEEIDFNGCKRLFPCFLGIEEFIRQAVAKLAVENVKTVGAELMLKIGKFISFFYQIELDQISPPSKEKALKIVGEAIGKGFSVEEVRTRFEECVNSIRKEEAVRSAFLGVLIGESEWTKYLGVVETVPWPEGILSILNQPCPITPDKKVGETHILVLIPSTVNGQPLTINSLGCLVKDKGYFPKSTEGYAYVDPRLTSECRNKRVDSSHYLLMTKEVLPESRCKDYIEQQAMVAALSEKSQSAYEVPKILPTAVCIYMNYLVSSGSCLFNGSTYTRCQEQVQGCSIVVGGCSQDGLRLHDFDYNSAYYGVAAERRL